MQFLRGLVWTQVFWEEEMTQDAAATVEEHQVKAVSLRCLLSDAAQAKP